MACDIVSDCLPALHGINVDSSWQKRVFQKRVLRRVFGRKNEEGTGVWTKLRKDLFGTDCFDNQIGPSKTKRRPPYLKTQSVPRCKHFSSRL